MGTTLESADPHPRRRVAWGAWARRSWLALILPCSVAAGAEPTGASHDFELVWSGLCDGSAATRSRLSELLGADPALRTSPPMQVAVEVKPESSGLSVTIVTRQAARSFRRELSSEDCAGAIEASALVLAFAIDPNLVMDAPHHAVEPPATVSPSAAEKSPPPGGAPARAGVLGAGRTEPPEADALEPTPRDVRVVLSGAGIATFGIVPSVGFGAELGARVDIDRLELGARGFWLGERVAAREGSNGASADIAAFGAGVQLGVRVLDVGAAELSAHAALLYALQSARRVGDDVPASGSAGFLGAALGPTLAFTPVKPLALFVRGEVAVPLARPRFLLGDRELFRSAELAAIFAAGVSARY